MADELSIDITGRDKGASDAFTKVGAAAQKSSLLVDQANIRVEKSQRSADAAIKKYGSDSFQAREASVKLAAANQKLNDVLQKTAPAAEEAKSSIGGVKEAFAAIAGGALAAGVVGSLNKALDIGAGRAKLQAQLGATTGEAGRYGKIAGELYSSNFGSSMEDVNEAVRNVTQNIGQLGDTGESSLKNIAADALSVSQAFDVDLAGSTKAAGALIKSGLAANASDAFDIITTGLQKIPGAQEDLLDTLNEYAVQFKALGLTAPQALAFIESAMQGGARNTDLAADALKEFNLRSKDLTNTGAQQALTQLGLNAKATAEQIAGGGGSAAGALAEVLKRLEAYPDPAKRATLATQLLGTQAEDLQGALLAVDPQSFIKGLDGIDGSAAQLSTTLGSSGQAKIDGYQRKLEGLVNSAAGSAGPLGVVAAGTAAFGGAALSAVGSVGQLVGGLSTIPGVGTKAAAALTAARTATLQLATASAALGPAFAVVATAAAAVAIGKYVGEAQSADVPTAKLADSLRTLAQTGKLGKDGVDLFQKGLGPFKRDATDAAGAVQEFGKQADGALGESLSQKIGRFGDFGERVAGFNEKVGQLDSGLASLVQHGDAGSAAKAFDQLTKSAVAQGVPLSEITAKFPQYAAAVKDAAATQSGASATSRDLGAGLDAQAAGARAAADALTALNKKTATYTGQVLSQRAAQRDFQAAIDDASASVKENGKTLSSTTSKGRANAAALDNIADKGLALAQNTRLKGAPAQEYFQKTLDRTRGQLINAAKQMGLSSGAAKKLADRILGIPAKRSITINARTAAAAAAIRGLTGQVNNLAGRKYSFTVAEILTSEDRRDASAAARAPHRATGGPVKAGQTYVVGEHRPELFVPTQDGIIVPTVPTLGQPREVQQVGGSGGASASSDGGGQALRLEIVSGGTRMDDLLVDILRSAVKVRGGNVQKVLGR